MMARYLLKPHAPHPAAALAPHGAPFPPPRARNPLVAFQQGFERRFAALRAGYRVVLGLALVHRARFVALFLAAVALSFVLVPWLGRNFFPSVDAGEIAIHVRAPIGTRIEETAALFDHVEQTVRGIVPPHAIASTFFTAPPISAPTTSSDR